MTAEQIASLRAGGHSVLAHRYNDLAECPACSPAEACGEDHIIGTKPETCFACLSEQRDDLLAALTRLHRTSESFVTVARFRGEDLREEAAHDVRNALAIARDAISKAQGGRTAAR